MKLLAALGIGAMLLSCPLVASADTAMAPAMSGMKHDATDATMLCRPAAAGEKPTAMMGDKGIVCKMMTKMMKNGMMMVPATKSSEADKAWKAWLESAMSIPTAPGGNG